MRIVIAIIFIFIHLTSFAQVDRIEPLNWWVGMNNPNVQLLIYGNNISKKTVRIDYPGVELIKQQQVENPNYLFLDLKIHPDAKAGKVSLVFQEKGKKDYVKA